MYKINDDLSIYVTRGDIVIMSVSAEYNGKPYTFTPGDNVRFKVYKKKKVTEVLLDKLFTIETATQEVQIYLSGSETKFDEPINKPTTYWYEVVLNEDTEPQTIIGYDEEEGAKLFILLPEGVTGEDVENYDPSEDERYMDYAALVKEMAQLEYSFEQTHAAVAEMHVTPQMYGAVGDGVADDTEAFKAMVADGKPITIPEGEYLITETLTLGDNSVINGRGAVVKYTGTGALFEVKSNYDNRSKINGLRAQGNGTNGFIKCDNGKNWGASFIVEDCHVSNFGGHAIELIGGYSAEIKDTFISHVAATPCIASTGTRITNVLKLTNTVFLGDDKRLAVFVDTTNLVCLMCDSTTFELGDKAVIGSYPAHFTNCWFEKLNLVTTNTTGTMIGCNVADCGKCVDGGDGVSLNPIAFTISRPNLGAMSVQNPVAEMMARDEFYVDSKVVDGTYNGTYYSKEISKLTNKGMCYNVPLNLLAASGNPNSSGSFFMYKAPPFASVATYKLELIGVSHYSNGDQQVTHANALLKGGVLIEYNKTDNHTEGRYDGVFGYDKSNAAFYFKNVSANVTKIDLMVEFNLVAFN